MKVVVIGGTGHIGTYLVPRLIEGGCDVVCVSRGTGRPYREPGIWREVYRVELDRQTEEAEGRFGERIASFDADAVIDLICFDPKNARSLVEALRGRVGHFLLCGTIWVHGHSTVVPTTEAESRRPFGEYGIKKAAIEEYLLLEYRRNGFPATVLHPGHIVGPGWMPLNPQGNFNPGVFERLAHGEELPLPNLGMETVHHVHADDVAQAFIRALDRRTASVGESFHAVSAAALTLRGYAERMARWFGREANIRCLPWDEFRNAVREEDASATWDHIAHSPNCSIEKARREIGYAPRYTSIEAVIESVDWLAANGKVSIPYRVLT
ncbi:MAG: NAD-dependent epimerase/dehydratase family protein [Spirochaetales bacterium]|nr:NAD-dependent epimerase/dehydratase family protein [Spirochaetales bacterium]